MSWSGHGMGIGSSEAGYEQGALGQAAEQDALRRRGSGLDTFDGRDHYRDNRRAVFVFLLLLAGLIGKFFGYW